MMQDDGLSKDPVSGNDVPPGATAAEVRDQVDAKLSPGEYVVPADVLQYYGVKFFEKLRDKAKVDLKDMDSRGRMGGQSVEEDMSDEDMQLLREVMAMKGGDSAKAFNEGGVVQPNAAQPSQPAAPSSFNPAQWGTVGFGGMGQGPSQYRTYYGPDGRTMLILFVNGQPTQPIPKGFSETKPTAVQAEDVKDYNNEDNERNAGYSNTSSGPTGNTDVNFGTGWAEKNYDELMSDPIGFGMDALQGDSFLKGGAKAAGALLGGPGMLLGAGVSGAMEIQQLASAEAALKAAEEQGLDGSGLRKSIEEFKENLSNPAKALTRFMGAGSGDQYYEGLQEVGKRRGTETPTTTPRNPTGTPSTSPSSSSDRGFTGSTSTRAGGSITDTATGETRETDFGTGDVSTTTVDLGGGNTQSFETTTVQGDNSGTTTTADGVGAQDEDDPRAFNKGGLVSKRRRGRSYKNKTKKKGLAAKK